MRAKKTIEKQVIVEDCICQCQICHKKKKKDGNNCQLPQYQYSETIMLNF